MSYHATLWAHRGQDTRRWAFYSIGAMMCPIDTGKQHGPAITPRNGRADVHGASEVQR